MQSSMFSVIPGFYPLDSSSTLSKFRQLKLSPGIANVSEGGGKPSPHSKPLG